MHIQVDRLSIKRMSRFPMWHANCIWVQAKCKTGSSVQLSCSGHVRKSERKLIPSYASYTFTHFSCGEPPTAGLSWLGFCGGWGFCCSGGRPPGAPWPGAAGRGCWVVGPPGRPCWPWGLCAPPCDCCLGGWAGLCCWGWPPAGFGPGPPAGGFCWEADCCLWVWGEPPWLRWGEPWPEEALWPEGAPWPCCLGCATGPWWALAWAPGSVAGLVTDCWACAGGWPWGCGRCWDGGLCWGPPKQEKRSSNHNQVLS